MSKVLVIDDYESDRKLIAHYAESAGHTVIESSHAINIIEFIENNQPDVIFLDIIMPEKEGVETVIEIKKKYPDLPIIVMTGLSTQYINIALQVGADDGLPKHLIASKTVDLIRKYTKK